MVEKGFCGLDAPTCTGWYLKEGTFGMERSFQLNSGKVPPHRAVTHPISHSPLCLSNSGLVFPKVLETAHGLS